MDGDDMAGRWRRQWAERDQVSRVDAYTRQSLFLLLWGSPVFVLAQAAPAVPADQRWTAAAVAVGGVLLTGLAHRVLRAVVGLHPRTEPLPRGVVGPFLALAAIGYVALLALPTESRGLGVMLLWSALAWSLGGLRDPRACAALLAVLVLVPAVASREPLLGLAGLAVGGFFVFTARVSLWLLAVVRELDRARHARAELAVAEERLRFSRDVHDVLGRRLSAIGLQAELAATLARRGDPSAADRMTDVHAIAHEALREARELARGYRATDLGQELEGARSLLRSAGIEVDLDVSGVPEDSQEPAAWVVREGVTNVLRHSRASRVTIRYAAGVLHIVNDRPGPLPGERPADGQPGGGGQREDGQQDGAGLVGLADRLAPLGATISTRHDADRFELAARLTEARADRSPATAAGGTA